MREAEVRIVGQSTDGHPVWMVSRQEHPGTEAGAGTEASDYQF